MKSQKVKEFDSKYLKKGENKWIDKLGGKNYLIELMEGKWSCVIAIESEK
jgi:hypothetical protein